jgi:hypothetical protein
VIFGALIYVILRKSMITKCSIHVWLNDTGGVSI